MGVFANSLGYMIKRMQCDYLTNALVMFEGNESMVEIKVSRKNRE